MLEPTCSPFAILGFEEVGPKPDGTPRRNRWVINIEVDGCIHRVFIRRSFHQVHIPLPLRGYPRVRAIERAIKDLMAPVIEGASLASQAALGTDLNTL